MTTPGTVERTNDVGGDAFRTFEDGGTVRSQAVGLIDVDGLHSGIEANPAKFRQPEPTTRYDTAALESQAQAKGSAGVIREITCALDASVVVVRYLHLFDQTAVLTGGEVPIMRAVIPAGGLVNIEFTGGRTVSTGLVVGISTTLVTYTAPGGSEGVFHVEMD